MIVGVDVSSRRIDLAWLQDGQPQRWHQELAKGHLIDRLRSIHIQWPGRDWPTTGVWDVTDIAIEYPYAAQRNAIAALMATTGIITRQAPPWARVAWPSSGELRAAIGAKNTKTAAHERIDQIAIECGWNVGIIGSGRDWWDEHELDALTACIGWTRILEAQE